MGEYTHPTTLFYATSVLNAACALSQYPLENKNNRHSRKSVSAETARFPATISPIRCAAAQIFFALFPSWR